MRDVLKFTIYVTSASYTDAVLDVYAKYVTRSGAAQAPVITMVSVSDLFRPGLKVEVEALASTTPHESLLLSSWNVSGASVPVARAAAVGDWVFAVGGDSSSRTSFPNAGEALDHAVDGLLQAMGQAGIDSTDTVQCTAWLSDTSAFGAVESRLQSLLSAGDPSDDTRSRYLVALMPPNEVIGSQVQLEAVARRTRSV